MEIISKMVLPIFIVFIIIYGVKKNIDIYDTFLDGAKEGLITTFNIFPSVLAMIFAINIFMDSNVLGLFSNLLNPFLRIINVPLEIIPMALLRPISGNASLAIMNDIFKVSGPDSFIGRLASVLQGCTDTTIYVVALYYGTIKVSKTRYTLVVSLFADFVGIIMAIILTNIFF